MAVERVSGKNTSSWACCDRRSQDAISRSLARSLSVRKIASCHGLKWPPMMSLKILLARRGRFRSRTLRKSLTQRMMSGGRSRIQKVDIFLPVRVKQFREVLG